MSDGNEFNAKPGGRVDVPDSYVPELQASSAVRSGVISASQSFNLGTKIGRVCRPCRRTWQGWSETCPKCGLPTEVQAQEELPMVMYARSDINSIHDLTPGHTHARPKKLNGEHFPTWGIDCPPCEARLQGDPNWHRSRHRIPLTPDEQEEARDAQAAAEAALHQQQLMLASQALTAQMAAKGAVPDGNPEDVYVSKPGEDDDSPAVPQVVPAKTGYDYSALAKTDLKELARDRGLPVSGTSADLVARLTEYDNQHGSTA